MKIHDFQHEFIKCDMCASWFKSKKNFRGHYSKFHGKSIEQAKAVERTLETKTVSNHGKSILKKLNDRLQDLCNVQIIFFNRCAIKRILLR